MQVLVALRLSAATAEEPDAGQDAAAPAASKAFALPSLATTPGKLKAAGVRVCVSCCWVTTRHKKITLVANGSSSRGVRVAAPHLVVYTAQSRKLVLGVPQEVLLGL